jgi:hypothetical protein
VPATGDGISVSTFPGDLIFTGTPAGIGWTREPQRTLRADDELLTYVEGVGEMRHRFRPAVTWRLSKATDALVDRRVEQTTVDAQE